MDASENYIKMCAALPGEIFKILEFEPVCINNERRRLPRIDKLLELSGQRWDTFFQDCIDWKTDLEEFEIQSVEQAGLIMIMYENYGMIWTGDAWEEGEY